MRLTKAGRLLLGLGTRSSFDVDFQTRVRRGALVAGLFGLALACALAPKAAAVGTTATASDTPASALSTRTTVELEAGSESEVAAAPAPGAEPQVAAAPALAPGAEPQVAAAPEPAPGAEPQVAAIPEPAPGAEPQVAATPEPAPGAEPQEPATPEPAPGANPQEPATPELESPGTSEPVLALRAEPQSPGPPEPAPRAGPQSALVTAPTATDPAWMTQTKAAFRPVALVVRPAPRRPATLSAAGPWRAAASPLPFALPPDADVTSLPALGPSASSRGPDAAASDRTKRRRAEGVDVEQGPRSPLGPLDRTFHAAGSAAPGGGAAPDLIWWCIIVLGLAAYRPQTLRRHCVRQVARRLVGFASFHEQPG